MKNGHDERLDFSFLKGKKQHHLLFLLLFAVVFFLCLILVEIQVIPQLKGLKNLYLWVYLFPLILFSLVYGITGVFLSYYMRISHLARLFKVFCLIMMMTLLLYGEVLPHTLLSLSHTTFALALALFVWLIGDFPLRFSLLTNTRGKRLLFIGYRTSVVVLTGGVLLLSLFHFLHSFSVVLVPDPARFPQVVGLFNITQEIVSITGMILMVYIAWHHVQQVHYRIFLAGSLLAFIPFFLLSVLPRAIGEIGFPEGWSILFSGILPIFIAYAVFRFHLLHFDSSIRKAFKWALMIIAMEAIGYVASAFLLAIHVPIALFALLIGLFLVVLCFRPLLAVIEKMTTWLFSRKFAAALRLMADLEEKQSFAASSESLALLSVRLSETLLSSADLAVLLFLRLDERGFLLYPSSHSPKVQIHLCTSLQRSIPVISAHENIWIENSPRVDLLRESGQFFWDRDFMLVPLIWGQQLIGIVQVAIQQDRVELHGQMEILQAVLAHILPDIAKKRREEIQRQRRAVFQYLVQRLPFQASSEVILITVARSLLQAFPASATIDIWQKANNQIFQHLFHEGLFPSWQEEYPSFSREQDDARSLEFCDLLVRENWPSWFRSFSFPVNMKLFAWVSFEHYMLILSFDSVLTAHDRALITEFLVSVSRVMRLIHSSQLFSMQSHQHIQRLRTHIHNHIHDVTMAKSRFNQVFTDVSLSSPSSLLSEIEDIGHMINHTSTPLVISEEKQREKSLSGSRRFFVIVVVKHTQLRLTLERLLLFLGFLSYAVASIEDLGSVELQHILLTDSLAYAHLLTEHTDQAIGQTDLFILQGQRVLKRIHLPLIPEVLLKALQEIE